MFVTVLAIFVLLFLLLALTVAGSLSRRIKIVTDRLLYRGRYDYREQWLRFSEEMSTLLSLEELAPQSLQMVAETLDVRQACILLPGSQREDFVLAAAQGFSCQELRIPEKSEFLEWLFLLGQPIALQDSRFDRSPAREVVSQRDRFRDLGFAVMVPLITKRKLVGILALGSKQSNQPFSSVDLELLEAMGNHLSVAVLNATLSEELVVSKELEFMHKISSFMIHDLKNAVSTLSLVLQNAAANMDKPEFRQSMLTTIAGTVEKMTGLIGKITTMPKDLQLDFKPYDVNAIIQKVVSKSRVYQMEGIRYQERLSHLPLIALDPEYVEQALTNLVVNALEAMSQRGTLSISTRLLEDGSWLAADDTRPLDRVTQFVEVEVSDTGPGMSAEFIKSRLFKPFQTTKRKGLGIGLCQCKEAVEAHGGRIQVTSREGEGTAVSICLPVVGADSDG